MKKFFVSLALVSGLLLVEAKADDTEKWCVVPKMPVIETIQMLANQGADVESLDGKEAQAYLEVLRKYTDIPDLPGIELVIVTIKDKAAIAVTFKGEFTCGRVQMKWHVHKDAWRAAKGDPV